MQSWPLFERKKNVWATAQLHSREWQKTTRLLTAGCSRVLEAKPPERAPQVSFYVRAHQWGGLTLAASAVSVLATSVHHFRFSSPWPAKPRIVIVISYGYKR